MGNDRFETFMCKFAPCSAASSRSDLWVFTALTGELRVPVHGEQKTMSEYFASLIQDLKIPLAASSSAIASLQDTGMEPDQKRHLMTLKQTWREMGCAVNNAFIIVEKERNALIPKLTLENIESLINDVILIRGSELIGKDLVAVVELDQSVSRVIKTDKLRLCQIVCNMMTRAIRFIAPRSGFTIKLHQECQDNRRMLTLTTIFEAATTELAERLAHEDPGSPTVTIDEDDGMNSGLDMKLVQLFHGRLSQTKTGAKTIEIEAKLPLYEIYDVELLAERNRLEEFKSLDMRVANIESYLRSLRSSKAIVVSICGSRPILNDHVSKIVGKIRDLCVRTNQNINELSLEKGAYNICLVDNLVGTVSEWCQRQDAETLKSTRFILLEEGEVDYNTRNLSYRIVKKPLMMENILVALLECIIRMSVNFGDFEAEQHPGTSSQRPSSTLLGETCPMHILVVEDSILNQQLLVKTLQKLGFTKVVTANDGQDALDKFKKFYTQGDPIQLIFMDMQMPVMDGCESSALIREFMAEPSSIAEGDEGRITGPHIVAMTASTFTEDKQTCLRSGMCSFTGKPVQWDHLYQVLEQSYEVLAKGRPCRCTNHRLMAW